MSDNSGSTPLHYAVSANNLEAVKVLLEADSSSAYVADKSGIYPIHVAAKLGYEQVVAEFFVQCPDSEELLDPEGRNFLHLAVEQRKVSVVQWVCDTSKLVKAMNSQDNNGNTPLHLAVAARDVNIFAFLVGSQNTLLSITNRNGLTPLDVAVANRTVGFKYWLLSPNYVIEKTLCSIGCTSGINRVDNFLSDHKLLVDPEKRAKMAEDSENMAKSNAIASTLIASAAFAGSFTVSVAYKRELISGRMEPELTKAFQAFIMLAACAFISAITGTTLAVIAALPFFEPEYRIKAAVHCTQLVALAIICFFGAFAFGVLVVMIIVSQWRLGYLIYNCCIFVLLLPLYPHAFPNILVIKAFIRRHGWLKTGAFIARALILTLPGIFVQHRNHATRIN